MRLSAISLAITRIGRAGAAGFSPLSLFAAGEQGAWYDPSDLSTLFTDAAGTTPVTADGQPVGKILDKSGRGNHATQSTTAARPLYKTDGAKHWLQFDGVDDCLSTAAINFTSTDKMSAFFGADAPSSALGMFLELSGNAPLNNGAFYITDNESQFGPSTYRIRGTIAAGGKLLSAPPDKTVQYYGLDISGDSVSARVNGASASGDMSAGSDAGTGNFGNHPLYIGQRAGSSLPFSGRIYSLIVRGALSTTDEITATESWVNARTGAF